VTFLLHEVREAVVETVELRAVHASVGASS
jgi:hypothetical protein